MEAMVSCATVGGRRFYTAAIRDISLQQEMEKAVYEARKTQAIGALAGGIAHDFNNILTAIISQIDLALTSPEFPPSLRDNLIYAQTSARRGAELVSKLQVFSRQGKPSFALLDVTEVLDQVVFMLRRSMDPRVQLQYLPPAVKPWLVKADANQITQALLNLGLNARDAMPEGGRLTLEVANVAFSAGAPPPQREGQFVKMTVADTGYGISPETLSRIFEPYFSTKDASRGPGLGLSIASATVAEHGGWMEVESREGEGTQFHVLLPRSAETESTPREAPVSDPMTMEGHERILVVDDEELVRMVTKAVLAYRGYQVVEAEDGEDAIEKYTKASPPIDLVLMDMHMPRLNGHDALLRIREANPKAKAVMFSGGLHDRASDAAASLEGVAFLHKPFENQELIRVVREMLDA
jgi:nitrogen-specific signal transduction histidine kinase/ActR/RegA family two-component response regulator